MKRILLASAAAFLMSVGAQAKQIVIDGQQSQYREFLATTVSHTEYRTEYREITCSRQVLDGYRQECHYEGGERECHTEGGGQVCGITPEHGRVCHDQPGRTVCYDRPGHNVCHNVPYYRTEYYSCTQAVQVPYQVRDYDVENDVTVTVERNNRLRGVQEVIDLGQNGAAFVLNAIRTSGKVLISATQNTREVSFNGSLKRLVTSVNIKLIDRYAAVGPFTAAISEITGDINELQITTGLITDLSLLRIELVAKKNRLIGDDPVVIQKVLTLDDMTLVNNGSQTTIRINFNKLGGPQHLSGKRSKIDISILALLPLENILNRQDMPETTAVSKQFRANF